MTTAARSRDLMRHLGYLSEVVEHRQGRFLRKDLFDLGDTLAIKPGAIILIQAYRSGATKQHAHLNGSHPTVRAWLRAGGRFQHHRWFARKAGWMCRRLEVTETAITPYPDVNSRGKEMA